MKPGRKRRTETRLLTAVSYRPASSSLAVVYEDGEVTDVDVGNLKLPDGAVIKGVRLDEFHRGIEFQFVDGTTHDVSADYITWLIDEAYRRDYPDDDIGPHVGANVAALRKREGMSQAELAKAANIRGPNLSRLETGKHVPTLDVLLRVARALQVSLGKLLGPTIRLESSKKTNLSGSRRRRRLPRRSNDLVR